MVARTFRPSKAIAVEQEARKLGFSDARMVQVSGHVGAVVIGDTWIYDDSEWAAYKLAHGLIEPPKAILEHTSTDLEDW